MSGTVSVVIRASDHPDGLPLALGSIAAQTRPVDEVVLVGDVDGVAVDVLGDVPVTRVACPVDAGSAVAHNLGLRAATGDHVLFLGPGERLTSVAVAAGLDCSARRPGAALVHGVGLRPGDGGPGPDGPVHRSLTEGVRGALLRGQLIPVHATVLYRREPLVEAGGFDEDLPGHEDFDVQLRLTRAHDAAAHPFESASGHRARVSEPRVATSLVRSALLVHTRHRPGPGEPEALHVAWARGRAALRSGPATEVLQTSLAAGAGRPAALLAAGRVSSAAAARAALPPALRWTMRSLPGPLGDALARLARVPGVRPRGRIRFGDLATAQPVSLNFGFDRGTPLDRHYIEDFLARHAGDIRGRVLEVGDDTYSRRFGAGRVDRQDVLHIRPDQPGTTIVGDLAEAGVLPAEAFDCIVLPQTLHLVYDMPAAVRNLYAALRPGGVLLLTVPGISAKDRYEWGAEWLWALMPDAVRRLLGDAFGRELVAVESHGNAFAATAFLQGLALEELPLDRLELFDPAYPVTVTARALKLA